MKTAENIFSSHPPRTANPRCAHLSPAGRQCSQPVCSSSPTFCFTHKPPAPASDQILLQELTEAAASLDSPEVVNRVLGKIFMALLQDRISLKKAGTLGFLGQMLLRSHREIAFYQRTHRANTEQTAADERRKTFLEEQDRRKQRIAEAQAAERLAEEQGEAKARKAAAKAEAQRKREAKIPKPPEGESLAANLLRGGRKIDEFYPPQAQKAPDEEKLPPPAEVILPQRPPDLNHFYPRDPLLIQAGLQDANAPQARPRDFDIWETEINHHFGPLHRRRY